MGKNNRTHRNLSTLLSDSAPFSYKEAYKSLRTNLSFASINKQCKTILITSSIPNEGKSTVAVNLAISLAESDAKVLLVDCDLRKSTLRRLLGEKPDAHSGLTSLLTGKTTREECIFKHAKINCDVLLAGTNPPNPAELLSSPQMEELLKDLSSHYDYIICDTPPVSVVTDAAALSRFCDGVILVIRQKFSTREQVWMAKRNLDAVEANIIGTILSCYDMSDNAQSSKMYYRGYYQYGYSSRRQDEQHD